MSAVVQARPAALAGSATLLRFGLRRDRVRLAVWVLALGSLAVYTVVALDTVYPTAADRAVRAALMTNPAAVMFAGPGFGLAAYSRGAMVANELGLTVMIAAAIMSVLLVVRHTRAEEESGRAELVRASVVGRRAQLSTAMGLVALANAAVALIIAAGLLATGFAAADTAAFALGIGLTGAVFGAVAAVTAQLTGHTRAASGAALAVLGAAAVVRGVGDVLVAGGSALSWFSPIAWAQQTRVFVDLRWWPLLLPVALVAALVALAYRLADRRDVGLGLLPARRGPAAAGRVLAGPVGLAVRLQRAALAGWGAGLALLGVAFGSLSDSVATAVAENPRLASFIAAAGGGDVTAAFHAVMVGYVGLGAAAFAVSAVLRLRAEEEAGRAEPMLAGALDRRRWLGGSLLVTGGGAAVLLLAGGLGMGLAAAAVSGTAAPVGALLGAALAQLPAVLVVAAVAAALVGGAPRLAGLAWVLLGYAVLAGMFGGLLRLPEWALELSPFGSLPRMPAEPFALGPAAGLTAVAALLVAAALAGIRSRDLATT